MSKKRIVVTGLGVVSCFGNDVELFYDSLLKGISGVSMIDKFNTDEFTTKFAAFIKNFDAGDYIDKKQARRIDPFIAYAIVAGKKALEMAGLYPENQLDKTRAGILIGSGMGGMGQFADGVDSLIKTGPKRVTPFFVPYILTNMAGGLLAMDLEFMGPNYSISTACATGNNAIIAAAEHLRRGDADLIVCGGSEAAVIPMGIAGFNACKALSTRNDDPQGASRPGIKTAMVLSWVKDRELLFLKHLSMLRSAELKLSRSIWVAVFLVMLIILQIHVPMAKE